MERASSVPRPAGADRRLARGAPRAGRPRRPHPQLERFRTHDDPIGAITAYLHALADEADARGFRYDRRRIDRPRPSVEAIEVTSGQLDLEWAWLRRKLAARSPDVLARWAETARPDVHPSFVEVDGPIAPWERNAVTRSPA